MHATRLSLGKGIVPGRRSGTGACCGVAALDKRKLEGDEIGGHIVSAPSRAVRQIGENAGLKKGGRPSPGARIQGHQLRLQRPDHDTRSVNSVVGSPHEKKRGSARTAPPTPLDCVFDSTPKPVSREILKEGSSHRRRRHGGGGGMEAFPRTSF